MNEAKQGYLMMILGFITTPYMPYQYGNVFYFIIFLFISTIDTVHVWSYVIH